MAAIVMSSPQRQPFASLGGSRLRSLGNIKNCQNGMLESLEPRHHAQVPVQVIHSNYDIAVTAQLTAPTKRRAPEPSFDDVDQENFNPEFFSELANKKVKNFDFNALKSTKPSKFVLTKANSSPATSTRPIITPKRLQNNGKTNGLGGRSTPLTVKTTQPSSAPAALTEAGRKSPVKSKRVGILSRHRVSSSPVTRVNPPACGLNQGLPFSIDAALSSTVATFQSTPIQDVAPVPVATIDESIPPSWQFDIYEDTPEEYASTIMQHSMPILDISDDEGRLSPARSNRDENKENIAPADASSAYAVSRRDMMTDEPRSPLGNLTAADYYADGCDANSFVIVPGDQEATCSGAASTPALASTPATTASEASSAQEGWKEILDKLRDDRKVQAEMAKQAMEEGKSEFEVWESESANAENEGEGKTIKTFEWVSPLGSPKEGSEAGAENSSPL